MEFNQTSRNQPVLQGLDPYFEDYKYRVNYGAPFSPGKSTRDRGATLEQAMNMISILIKDYELEFYPNASNSSYLLFPYMFIMPDKGNRLINTVTNDILTIEEVVINPVTKLWEGVVRVGDSPMPPTRDRSHKLKLIDKQTQVRFIQEFSTSLEGQNSKQSATEAEIDAGPMSPTITWALIRKEPASFGKSPFGPQKQYKPRHRELVRDPDAPGQSIDVRVQGFDNLVQFDCWALDNFTANKLVNWFEKFLSFYIPILKRNGVQELLYWQRLRDASVTRWRQDAISRTLQYFIRTEDIEIVIRKNLNFIDYDMSVDDTLEDLSSEYIAGQLIENPGQLTIEEYNNLFKDSNGNYLFSSFNINDGNLT